MFNVRVLFVVLALLFSALFAEGGGKTVQKKLPRGMSAWSYHFNRDVGSRIKKHNKAAKNPIMRFSYFFPYVGSLSFKSSGHDAGISYKKAKTSDCAKALPRGIWVLPIIDARDDKKYFRGWTDDEYKTLALSVAKEIIKDRKAAGAQVDIEPFNASHLPFYKHLKEALNAKGKILTMFVGMHSPQVMAEIFKSCDILVFSGYDGAGRNPGPAKYGKTLKRNLAKLQKLAEQTGGKYMVGIPAAASWGEYEYTIGKSGKKVVTGYKQIDYARTSLDAIKPYESKKEFLGISLWVLSHVREKDDPKAKGNQPDYIRPAVWKLLEK